MRTRLTVVTLSAIFAFSALAMSGCAQFQNSFGELSWSDSSRQDPSAAPADSTQPDGRSIDAIDPPALDNGAPTGHPRTLTLGGLLLEMGDGHVTQ